MLVSQDPHRIREQALEYVNEELGVDGPEAALQGAMDILAEELAEDAEIRKWVREFTWRTGQIQSKAKDPKQRSVYEMYYDYHEPVHTIPSHRVLAISPW